MRNELASMVGMTLVSLVMIYGPVAIAGETYGNALVLGGGGPVGEAWESGVIAGLADRGIYLSRMDRIIGTSAGAVVGARLAMGMTPEQLTQQAPATERGKNDGAVGRRRSWQMGVERASGRDRIGVRRQLLATVPEKTMAKPCL